ncbi:MAG: hypothetical protein IK081_11540 [Lachnospiraceae bacterium]|nr:hypothetical protein [Lachnospiraceae bacterium]
MEMTFQKTTEELMHDIADGVTMQEFVTLNAEEMMQGSLSAYLRTMLERYQVKKADVFRKAGLVGSNYGYEIFQSDKKTPSRDILLMICLAFPMTIDETQRALRHAGLALLYPRDARDAYVLYALKNQTPVDELNTLLHEKGLRVMGK